MTKPTHLVGPMAAVLAVGSHDDNLLKVRDFWKRDLRKSTESKTTLWERTNPNLPHKQMLVPGLQETDHKPTSDKPPEEAKVTTHSNPHSSMCDNMAQTTRKSLETMA